MTFTLDEIGQIIRRDETRPSNAPSQQVGSPHELWFRMGDREIGYIGNNGGEDPTTIGSYDDLRKVPGSGTFRLGSTSARNNIGFAQALDPININEQGSTAGGYTVRSGDTLEGLAQRLYGDAGLWYKIAEVNGLSGGANLIAGQQLILPSGVTRNTYTSDSYRPYDPAQAMGDLSPSTPKPAKKPKCGVLGQILLAAIAIRVSLLLPELAPALFKGFWGGVAASVAGSVASQAVGVATGIQEKFSFKSVAITALSAGLTQGLGDVGAFGKIGLQGGKGLTGVLQAAARGAITSAAMQGIGVATGLQDKFSWAGVAAAGVSAGVGQALGGGLKPLSGEGSSQSFGNIAGHLGVGMARLLASSATRSAITGESFGDAIRAGLPDVIGQVIGSAFAGAVEGGGKGATTPTNGAASAAPLAQAAANREQAQGNPVATNGGADTSPEWLEIWAKYGTGYAGGPTFEDMLIAENTMRQLVEAMGYQDVASMAGAVSPGGGTSPSQPSANSNDVGLIRRAIDGSAPAKSILALDPYRIEYVPYSDEMQKAWATEYATKWHEMSIDDALPLMNELVHRESPDHSVKITEEMRKAWGGATIGALADYEVKIPIPEWQQWYNWGASTRAGAFGLGIFGAATDEVSALNPGFALTGEITGYVAGGVAGLARKGGTRLVVRETVDETLEVAAAGGEARVLFGQRRVGPTFGVEGRPDYLAGRSITDVASDLRSGMLHPDQLPIDAFRVGDNLVSANTRSLAALSEAGLSPTLVNEIQPTSALLRRLRESPIIPNAPLPGPRVPVTPSQSNLDVLRIIELPR